MQKKKKKKLLFVAKKNTDGLKNTGDEQKELSSMNKDTYLLNR